MFHYDHLYLLISFNYTLKDRNEEFKCLTATQRYIISVPRYLCPGVQQGKTHPMICVLCFGETQGVSVHQSLVG